MFVMDEPLNEPNENKDVIMDTGNTKLNGNILNNNADGDVEMEDLSESNNGSSLKFVKSPPTSVLPDITKQTCGITNGHISEENMDCDGEEEEESNDINSSHNVTNDSISNRDINLKEKPSENDLGKDNDITNHNHSSTLLNGETNVIETANSLPVEKENSVNTDENNECLDLSSASQSLPDSSKDFNAIKNVADNFNRDKQMDHKVETREIRKTEVSFEETKTEDAKITSTIEDEVDASSKNTKLDNESRADGKQKLADSVNDENMFDANEENKESSDEPSTAAAVTPRRSSRNINKQKTNSEKDDEEADQSKSTTSVVDDDIEEITPTDPLADESSSKVQSNKPIVVNDAKGLVEFASNSKQIKSNKKEPTLVIIDTNSILSGRGPVPISQSSNTVGSGVNSYSNTSVSAVRFNSSQPSTPLPTTSAVGTSTNHLYPTVRNPPQMKPLVITPVTTSASNSSANTTTTVSSTTPKAPVILPSLTDDMFVVEAPSFIVPYVYEKPPMKSLKGFVEKLIQEVKEMIKEQENSETESKITADKLDEDNEATERSDDKVTVARDLVDKSKETNESAVERMDVDEVDESIAKQSATTSTVTDENVKIKDEPDDKLNDMSEKVENTCDSNASSPFGEVKKDDIKLEAEDLSVEKQPVIKKESEIKKEEQQPSADGSLADKKINENDSAEKIKKTASGNSFFDNPLGKFFMQIGLNLVQEYVQTDLLRSQRRKRDKEGNRCPQDVIAAIESLSRTLEFSRETNDPFRLTYRKCELCSFKTESVLAMVHHLETPHMKNYTYRCNFCPLEVRSPHDILYHMEAEHNVRGRLERAPAFHQCPNCPFEDNQKGKLTRHLSSCCKKYRPERNQEPPLDWEQPAKIPRVTRNRPPAAMNPGNAVYQAAISGMKQVQQNTLLPKLMPSASNLPPAMINKNRPKPLSNLINRFPNNGGPQPNFQQRAVGQQTLNQGLLFRPTGSNGQPPVMLPSGYPQIYQNAPQMKQTQPPPGLATNKLLHQPSISITPLPRQSSTTPPSASSAPSSSASSSPNLTSSAKTAAKPPATNTNNRSNSNNAFVICEICDGYIKDLEQLRNHMQWIHKVKIHPKMIYNRPPLNCQKCQFRFFTDQGLERHLLGSHGLVTSSMQEAANKGKDGGRCPVCGRVYQWKLLNHVARDHNMALKPAHLSYKCTVCTATFGMYKQFESHVYSAHSVVAKRAIENKKTPMPPPPTPAASSPGTSSSAQNETMLKPLKITDEITIIPQPARVAKSTNSKNASANPTSSRSKDNEGSQYSCIICEQIFCEQQQYQDHVIGRHMKKFSIALPRIDDDAIVTVEADIEHFLALDQDDLVPPNDQCKSFWIELPMIDDDGKKVSVPHLSDNAKLSNSTSTVTPVALDDGAGSCVIVETVAEKNVSWQSDAHSNLPLTQSVSLEENYYEYEEEEEEEEFSCFEQLMRYGHFLGRTRCRWSNNRWNDNIRQWMDKLNKRSAGQNKSNRILQAALQKVAPSQVVKRVIPIRPRAPVNPARRDNPVQQRYFVIKPPQIRQPQSVASAVHHVQRQMCNRIVVTNRPDIFKYKFLPVRPANASNVIPTFFNAEQCIGKTGVILSINKKNGSNSSSNSQNTPRQFPLVANNTNNSSNNQQVLVNDSRNITQSGANFRPGQQLCFAIVTNNNAIKNKYSNLPKTVVPAVRNSTIIDLCDDDDINSSADNAKQISTNSNGTNCQLVTADMIEQEILGI